MTADRIDPEELMLPAGDTRLHVLSWPAGGGFEEAGKTPIVLLHGIASCARSWDPAARLLARAGHPTYALDFRGHGRSLPADGGFDLPTFAEDVANATSLLELERPVLAGHSLGAMAILEGVASGSLAPSAVALVEGGLVDASSQYATLEECLASLKLPPVDGMPAARVEGFLRSTHPSWTPERLAGTMAGFEALPDGTVRWCVGPAALESLGRSMWKQRAAELWPAVVVPALVIAADTGDEHWTSLKRSAAGAAEQALPHGRVAWLTADHDVHADRPAEVAELLLAVAAEAGS